MSERNYDKEPIVLRTTIEIYVYEDVNGLDRKVAHFNNRLDVQEAALNLVGGYFSDDCGLNECKVEVISS